MHMPGSSFRWSWNVAVLALHSSGSCATSHGALLPPAEIVSQMTCLNPGSLLVSHLHAAVVDERSMVHVFRFTCEQEACA